jgi:4-hydroxybenzoate polyprenyltransferase
MTDLRRSGAGVVTGLRLSVVEARPVVLVVFLMRFATAALPGQLSGRVAVAAVSLVATVLAVYLLNGIADVTEDRWNKPARPIASGKLNIRTAKRVAGASAVVATVGGAFVGLGFLAVLAAFLGLGYVYSMQPLALKRHTFGALAVVFLGGVATYLAGLMVSGGRAVVEVSIVGLAMSSWMALVGALTKDFSDVAGDRAAHRRTAVIVWGPRRTGRLVAALASAVAVGFLVAAVLLAPILVPVAIIVGIGAARLAWHFGHDGRGDPYRMYMVTQYAAHAAAIAVSVLLSIHR